MPVSACTCCGSSCITSATCPGADTTSSYTVSIPLSISWGSCANPVNGACSPNHADETVNHIAGLGCVWGDGFGLGGICIGGWVSNLVQRPVSFILQNADPSRPTCYDWYVRYDFSDLAILGVTQVVTYQKLRSDVSDSPIGTYSLFSIIRNGVACSGASSDATITVSP